MRLLGIWVSPGPLRGATCAWQAFGVDWEPESDWVFRPPPGRPKPGPADELEAPECLTRCYSSASAAAGWICAFARCQGNAASDLRLIGVPRRG